MSSDQKTQDGHGNGEGKRVFPFRVDGRQYHAETAVLTGGQIKAIAAVDPSWGLFIEGHGGAPNQQIGDGDRVDLSQPGREQFFSMPGATYGRPAAEGARECAGARA